MKPSAGFVVRVHRGRSSEIKAVKRESSPRESAAPTRIAYNGPLSFTGEIPGQRIFGSSSPLLIGATHDFATTASLKSKLQKVFGPVVEKLREAEMVPMPSGCRPQFPEAGRSPLIGIRGDLVPGWVQNTIAQRIDATEITRMANASKSERRHEAAFAEGFCAGPAAMVKRFEELSDGVVFGTDQAKRCYGPWGSGPHPKTDDEKKIRATMNAALHGTASAIVHLAVAKRMFRMHEAYEKERAAYDAAKAKGSDSGKPPKPPRIAMNVGGCGAGKGVATSMQGNKYALIFDAAGEAESTEVPWMMKLCHDYGFKLDLICVERDVDAAAARTIQRESTSGRIVDLVAFARSHTVGIDNFRKLAASAAFKASVRDGWLNVHVYARTGDGGIHLTDKTTMDEPKVLAPGALEIALKALAKATKNGLNPLVVRGCLTGVARTWRCYDQWFDEPAPDAKSGTKSAA